LKRTATTQTHEKNNSTMQSNERKGTKAQKSKIKPKDDVMYTSDRIKYKYHNQCKTYWSVTACLKR